MDEPTKVDDTERIEVEPTTEEELVEPETETPEEDAPPEEKPAEEQEEAAPAEEPELKTEADELKTVDGETPRERALRLEVDRLRRLTRQKRTQEMFDSPAPRRDAGKPDKDQVLSKYDKTELENLKEVLEVYAEDMGFVRKDQLEQTTLQSQGQAYLDAFLEKHPEYLPENDKDNTLWARFQEEFKLYAKPQEPKDFQKVFDRIHREIFGVQPTSELKKVSAQQQKLKAASHVAKAAPAGKAKADAPTLDPALRSKLKGFTDAEIDELFS